MTGNPPPADEVLLADRTRLGWLVRVWLLVGAFVVVTAAWSIHVGVPPRDPRGLVLQNRVTFSLLLFGFLVAVDVGIRTRRAGWSVGGAVAVFGSRWPWSRLATALSGLLAYHLVYTCYRNLKSWTAFNEVRDDLLTRVDVWLFFGNSPAVLLQDLLGRQMAAHALAMVYESFATLVSFSIVACVVFAPRLRDGFVFLASAMWLWVLGIGTYYLIPSLGPFTSEPQDFVDLQHTIITSRQAALMAGRANLLHDPGASDAFASVSAFASLHVAFSCLIVLMLRYYGLRWAARVMTAFLLATILATIYFGWHFVLDDVAGVAVAFLAVRLGRLTIYPRGRPVPATGPAAGAVE